MFCYLLVMFRRAKYRKKENTKKGPGRPAHNAHPQVFTMLALLWLCGSIAAPQAGNPGSIHAAHTNRPDWWLNPVTLLLGDKDIWMVLVT